MFGGVIVRTPSPSAGMIRIRFDGFTEKGISGESHPAGVISLSYSLSWTVYAPVISSRLEAGIYLAVFNIVVMSAC